MYFHRKKLQDLGLKKGKQGLSESKIESYKTLFEENPKKHYFL